MSHQLRVLRWSLRAALVAIVAGGGIGLATSTHAQQYKSLKPAITERASNILRPKVTTALRKWDNPSADQKAINEYFGKYYFPAMTDLTPEGLGQLAEMREDLFRRFIHAASVKAAQDYLTALTLKAMTVIASDNYHPAVRYNAVLILGQLDKEYSTRGTKPVPLPEATAELLKLMESDELNGVKVPLMLKVGALVGLERHCRFGLDPQYAERTTKAALAVIGQKELPPDTTADVYHWVQCQAARVLARQYEAGPTGEAHNAITGLVADTKLSLADRCSMAAILKEMDYSAANGVDTAAAVAALGDLAKDVMKDESAHAREYREEILGDGAGAIGRVGRGGSPRMGLGRGGPEGPEYKRNRLLARLQSLADGVGAIQPAAPPEQQEKLKQLAGLLEPVISTAGEKDALDEEVVTEVLRLAQEIDQMVDNWQSAASAETEQPAGDDVS